MLKQFLFIFCYCAFTTNAQEAQWKKLYEIPIDSGVVWSVDISKQPYIYQQQNITKYTAQGKKALVQSFKSLGDISGIDANNQLKIAVFSEEQQRLCFLDNALASSSDCISLDDFEVEWAQLFATSNQTDRFWVFDQVNSELKLITTGEQQQQVVQNLKQISEMGTPVMMLERNNNLYILDDKNQLTQFDVFGTLVTTFLLEKYSHYFVNEGNLFGIKDNAMYVLFNFSENTEVQVKAIDLPADVSDEIVSIKSSGDCFFFGTKNQLTAFQVRF